MHNKSEYETKLENWYIATGRTHVSYMPLDLFLLHCLWCMTWMKN